MSRSWRIEFDGALYHVLSRGNDQQNIFADDQDRQMFLDLIGEMAARFEIDVYAYVLMGNHYHLLLKTHRGNLSKSMQWFGATYTRKYNIRHKRSGHLFQGRFKSFLIENSKYLMRLSCYIHRNPIRAKIVKRLADYRWSSYPVYAYGKKPPNWLKTSLILSFFKGNKKEKIQAYRKKVQYYSHEEKSLWEAFRHGLFLGSREFIDKIKETYLPDTPHKEQPQQRNIKRSTDPRILLKKAAGVLDCDLDELIQSRRVYGTAKTNRDLLICFLWEFGVYTNEEIGNLFHITYSSVSKNAASVREKMLQNNHLKRDYNKIKAQFKL